MKKPYVYIPIVLVMIGSFYYLSINEFDRRSKIVSAVTIGVALSTFYVLNERKKRKDIKSGIPVEDELTIKTKVYAGNSAYYFSMILWSFIFIYHDAFPDPKTMLGLGILASAAVYGSCLVYFRSTQNFSNPNNQ